MSIQPHNLTDGEVISAAFNSDDSMLHRLAAMAENADEHIDEDMEAFLDDMALHFASEIDARLEQHNRDYYLSADSDYFDWVYCGDTYIEPYTFFEVISYLYDNDQLTMDRWVWCRDNIDQLRDEINSSLDYYCNLKIAHGYGAVPGSVWGCAIGECEEESKHWFDELPSDNAEFVKRVKEYIGTAYIADKYLYFDNSECSANLVLDTDLVIEYIDGEIDDE